MSIPPLIFPPGYDSAENATVEIPREIIPALGGLVGEWEWQTSWRTEPDYLSGYQAALLLQERLLSGPITDCWQTLYDQLATINTCTALINFRSDLAALQAAADTIFVPDCLLTNLVSYWKLDGSPWTDIHGSSNLTPSASPPGTAIGKLGNAATFDGSQYLYTSSGALDLTAPLSIAAWIKPTDPNDTQGIIRGYGPSSPYPGYGLGIGYQSQTRKLTAWVGDGTWRASVGSISAAWTHVAMTLSDERLRLYINGNLDSSYLVVPNLAYSGTRYIGGNPSLVNMFDGMIDGIGIWAEELTDAFVSGLYNEDGGLDYPFV